MKKETSTFGTVFIIILHTVIIFPFFASIIVFFLKKYTENAILFDFIHLLFLYLSLRYILFYISKKMVIQNPKKVFNRSLQFFGVVLLISALYNIGKSFEFYHLLYVTFYYWIKFLIFHEMTKKYLFSLRNDRNMIEYLQIDQKDDVMVFCRGCGKEIHESAEICPHCGAPQNLPSTKTNSVALFFIGLGWSIVLWIVSLFVIGFFIGLINPEEGAEIAGKFGEEYGLVLLLLSMIVSGVLTKLRILPGTGKKA